MQEIKVKENKFMKLYQVETLQLNIRWQSH